MNWYISKEELSKRVLRNKISAMKLLLNKIKSEPLKTANRIEVTVQSNYTPMRLEDLAVTVKRAEGIAQEIAKKVKITLTNPQMFKVYSKNYYIAKVQK